MTKTYLVLPVSLLLAAGCAVSPGRSPARTPLTELSPPAEAMLASQPMASTAVMPVNFESETVPNRPTLAKPVLELSGLSHPSDQQELSSPSLQRLPSTEGLSLRVLEQMALANHPAVGAQEARVRALRGKWIQVGLKPNPTAGYLGSEIGNEGAAGQQGGFVGQEFISANKLGKNRAIVASEIKAAEQELATTHKRVQTDVRQAYYNSLLASRRVELSKELVRVTGEASASSKTLYEAGEIPLAGLLQTEVQEQNALLVSATAQNRLEKSWRSLAAVAGNRSLPIQPLAGDVNELPEALDWANQLVKLQQQSPEIAVAMAKVERARRSITRECVEAVPNINAQLSVQYDDATEYTVTGVQIGMPIPIWNKNQGAIQQARSELTAALRNVEQVELSLQQRLSEAFQQYANSEIRTKAYATEILPRSSRTFSLVQKGYSEGELGYLDLLSAQQIYSQTNLDYLDALADLWKSYLQIDGLLLDGSLQAATR